MYNGIFNGLTVLVTGHTGFKGSWLTMWLLELGAKVVGYSLEPPTNPNLFDIARLETKITHIIGDVCDFPKLNQTLTQHQPQVIFHLAAQPIVLHSYEKPKETFDVNVGGTINLLEATRNCHSVKAVVVITTDKCYENQNWIFGYRENDRLGGHDPYSASKAMAELAVVSYRNSFTQDLSCSIATARAGNVIGGGDFSPYRLLPDTMKALMNRKTISVRNPQSIRPWLHVLDPLNGYLLLAQKLLEEEEAYAEGWNFGPHESEGVSVQTMVEKTIELWGGGRWINASTPYTKPEMGLLRLNWDKAANRLKWRPNFSCQEALQETVSWFKSYEKNMSMWEVSMEHIKEYSERGHYAFY